MVKRDFVQLLRQLGLLTQGQRTQVPSALDEMAQPPISTVAQALPGPSACPAQRCGVGAKWEPIAVLVVRDRSGQTTDFVLHKLDAPRITAVLEPVIDKDAILCADDARVYQAFAR